MAPGQLSPLNLSLSPLGKKGGTDRTIPKGLSCLPPRRSRETPITPGQLATMETQYIVKARPARTAHLCLIADVDDVMAWLELLARSPPLWPVGVDRWSEVVGALKAFESRYGRQARGWLPLSLWGLHRRAPYANLAGRA
jgi:hypothetical protein